jgi:hypothetical protein
MHDVTKQALQFLVLLQSIQTRNLEFNAEHVDEAWIQIAGHRFAQFGSGTVQPRNRAETEP